MAVQKFPARPDRVWEFFCNPANLRLITPPGMGFKILSAGGEGSISAGQEIRYRVKPVWGVPLTWVSLITQVENGISFTDRQLKGPFRYWQHHHHFEQVPGGTLMKDTIHYSLPMGWAGEWLHSLAIKARLLDIFSYRFRLTGELLGIWDGQTLQAEIS